MPSQLDQIGATCANWKPHLFIQERLVTTILRPNKEIEAVS